jgi:hypothetical protein
MPMLLFGAVATRGVQRSRQRASRHPPRVLQQRAARSAEVRRCGTPGHLPLLPCPNVVRPLVAPASRSFVNRHGKHLP